MVYAVKVRPVHSFGGAPAVVVSGVRLQCGMLRRFELLKNEAKKCSKKAIPAPVHGLALLKTVIFRTLDMGV